MLGFNVEFKLRIDDKDGAAGTAESLWKALKEKHGSGKAFGGVRITEGLPFEKVVARCGLGGTVHWL